MSLQKNALSSLVSAALVASAFGLSVSANAADNPFGAVSVGDAVQVAGMEGKCGEGKCGSGEAGNMPSSEMEGEGKCGEGKCGGDNKAADMKDGEGKCGEGKCGSK